MNRLLVWRLVPALAAAVTLLVLTAAAASAHAVLTSSDPPAGASVNALPRTVVLHFTDSVQLDGASVTLQTSSGSVALTNVRLDAPNVLVADVPGTPVVHGAVDVTWSVVADDGHPSTGVIEFSVGPSVASAPPTATLSTSHDATAIGRLFSIDRVVGYLAMATLVGGWVFLAAIWPAGAAVARGRLVLWSAWGCSIAATLAGIGLQAATISGEQLGHAVSRSALVDVLTSDFGHAWAARFALCLLAVPVLAGLRRGGRVPRSPWWIVSAAAVGIGLLRTPGFVSHAGEGDMAIVGSVADLVHLAGIAIWLGGLVFVLAVVLPRRRPRELARILPAFSKLAMGSVGAIVIGGTVMSWELVGGLGQFVDTHFGRVLLAKLAAFAAALALARISKRWVDDRLGMAVALRGHASIVRPFVYSIAAETVLATVVVAVASVLVATSPGT